MVTALETYDDIKEEVKKLYGELLAVSEDNEFLKKMNEQTVKSLNDLSISDEEKAKVLITIHTNTTEQTLTKTFDQALIIIDKGAKLAKELEEMDAKIDLIQEQKTEVGEAILDRQLKRTPEVTILNKQALLIDEQINKLKKDIDYIDAQKDAMIEQVADNKIIKAMDSMGETIGTLGNGGIRVPTKLFEVYLEQNQMLTNISKAGDTTLTKL